MIKANELRIGNKILNDGCIVTVKFIGDYLTVTTKQGNDITAGLELVKTIVLTPEILEKAAFEQLLGKGQWYDEKNFIYLGFYSDGYAFMDDSGNKLIKGFRALHSFQNAYFVFTGQELEINL